MGFSLNERDRRWGLVRSLMEREKAEILLVFPRWMPGDALFLADRPGVIIFPVSGDPVFIAPRPEKPRPETWIQDIRGANESGSPAAALGAAAAAVLKALGADGKRIAVAGLAGGPYTLVRNPEGYVNATSFHLVRSALPNAVLFDGTSILGAARYVKSEEEIAVLRESTRIGEAAMTAMARVARVGVPAREVYAEMAAAMLREGAEAHVAWGAGPWGERLRRVVGPPQGTLATGWVLKNECEAGVDGYTAQVVQPGIVGPAPSDARELFDLGKRAFARACELMRPGASWREVFRGVQAMGTAENKLEFLIHGRGLGDEGVMFIPTDDHESNPVADEQVRENTVFVLKPYAYPANAIRDDWTNGKNVTWGDSVVVRAAGAERLGTRTMELTSI